MSNRAARIKGKGWYVSKEGVIYVQGSVSGKFHRKSTKLKHTPRNEAYIKKNARDVLLQLIEEERRPIEDFATFARSVIASGAKRPGKRGGRSEMAQRDAMSQLERHVIPEFRSYRIRDIKVSHVEIWVAGLLKKYSTSTVSKCVYLLKEVMHKAVANDIIQKNPVDYIDPVDVTHQKQHGYSIEDARRMMTESEGWIHVWLNLAFTTGMRTGELMGLMWDDIDWDMSVIFLQRSISKGRVNIGSSRTKNHKRIVPIMPQAMEILRKWREESRSKWVFPSRTGEPYKESKAIAKRHLIPLLERLGIEYISLYATRHTFATIAENAMVDQETLSSIIGNSADVRARHYVDFQVTGERVARAHRDVSPVNSIFFGEERKRSER